MSVLEVLLIALALAADAFSVGVSVGLRHHGPRQIFRLSWHFGLFQSLLAAAGAGLGAALSGLIETWAHWAVFAILAAIGVHMIFGSFSRDGARQRAVADLTRGRYLVGLSVAVSVDAFAAGTGLGVAGAALVPAVITIGVVAALATLLAMLLADRIRTVIGRRAEFAGGLILILIGLKEVLA